MALSTYNDLIGAVETWTFGADTVGNNAADIVAMSVGLFNGGYDDGLIDVPPLRCRQQQTSTDLSDTGSTFTLPSDYAQYVTVTELASIRRPLSYIAYEEATEIYPDRPSGLGTVFTIVNDTMRVYPSVSNDVELVYYQKIELDTGTTTSWLLTNYPQVFLTACQMFAADLIKDDAEFAKHARRTAGFVNGLNNQDDLAQYANASLHIQGVTP